MNMQTIRRGWTIAWTMVALFFAGTTMVSGGESYWKGVPSSSFQAPSLWSDAANWFDGCVPVAGDNVYFTNNLVVTSNYYVRLPDEGVTVDLLTVRYPKSIGTIRFVGGSITLTGSNKALYADSQYTEFHTEIRGEEGATMRTSWGGYVFRKMNFSGPLLIQSGSVTARFDGWADSTNSIVENWITTNDVILKADLMLNGRGVQGAITATYNLTEGSRTAIRVSGTAPRSGSPVTGPGIDADTFVQHTPDGSLFVMNKPAMQTVASASLSFPAMNFTCSQNIRTLMVSNNNVQIKMNASGAPQMRANVDKLVGSASLIQSVSGGESQIGIMAVRDVSAFTGSLTMRMANLELYKNNGVQPLLHGVAVEQPAIITIPEADTTATISSMMITNTFAKQGPGSLEVAIYDARGNAQISVDEGTLHIKPTHALLSEAVLWFDANRPETFDCDANNRITAWRSCGTDANCATNGIDRAPTLLTQAVNGLSVVDFGERMVDMTGKSLVLTQAFDRVRSAFIVYYGSHEWVNFFGRLPGAPANDFTRSSNTGTNIWSISTGSQVQNGRTMLDGAVVNGRSTVLPLNEYHVVSVVTATGYTTPLETFAWDRSGPSGGCRIGEILVFDRDLSPIEQAVIDGYLREKWMGAKQEAQLAQLTVRSGATLALDENVHLITSRLICENNASVKGPGKITVTGRDSTLGQVMLQDHAAITFSNLIGVVQNSDAGIAANPVFWVDACSLTNASADQVVVENGTNFVVRWNDVRGSGYPFATNYSWRPIVVANAMNGRPVVKFTRRNPQSEGLLWSQPLSTIRSVFMVVDAVDGGGILLGSSAAMNTRDFYRNVWADRTRTIMNGSGTGAAAALLAGDFYLNGLPARPDVATYAVRYNVIESYPTEGVRASAFADDCGFANQNGCQCIAEVILYDRELTAEERLATAQYLARKWMGRDLPVRQRLPYLGAFSSGDAVQISLATRTATARLGAVSGSSFVKKGDGTIWADALNVATCQVDAGRVLLNKTAFPTNALLHLDASKTNTMTFRMLNGTNGVEHWYDCNGRTNCFAQRRTTDPARVGPSVLTNALNGLSVVDFGPLITSPTTPQQILMEIATNTVSPGPQEATGLTDCFVVLGSQEGGNCVFGGASNIQFTRTVSTNFAAPILAGDAAQPLRDGETYLNGVKVVPTSTGLSGGYDLLSFAPLMGTVSVGGFANRAWGYTGGQRLGEVLFFNRALSPDERLSLNGYLMKKWFNVTLPGCEESAITNLSVAAGAQIEFDQLAVSSLAGSGTFVGNLELREEGVLSVQVEAGVIQPLTVTGSFALPEAGTVLLTGATSHLTAGRQKVLEATTILNAERIAAWQVAASVPLTSIVTLTVEDNAIWASVSPKGSLMILK